jgi:hypothetical protein
MISGSYDEWVARMYISSVGRDISAFVAFDGCDPVVAFRLWLIGDDFEFGQFLGRFVVRTGFGHAFDVDNDGMGCFAVVHGGMIVEVVGGIAAGSIEARKTNINAVWTVLESVSTLQEGTNTWLSKHCVHSSRWTTWPGRGAARLERCEHKDEAIFNVSGEAERVSGRLREAVVANKDNSNRDTTGNSKQQQIQAEFKSNSSRIQTKAKK